MRPEDERPDFDGDDGPPRWFLALLVAGALAAALAIALALAYLGS